MKKILLTVFIILVITEISFAFAQVPIVYVRCERTTAPFVLDKNISVNGVRLKASKEFTGIDIYDVLPDVTNFFSNFSAPCDLVRRDADGTETVLFDCSGKSTNRSACAALDPAVSFDGKKIAFSVFRGTLAPLKKAINSRALNPNADTEPLSWHELPNKLLNATGAHLHIIDTTTNTITAMPYVPGIFDAGPTYTSRTRLSFTSNRDGNTSTVVWRTTGSRIGSRIWAIDTDWKNLDLSSHHSLSQEQHPIILQDGRLAFSSWQIFGGLPFRYSNGSAGGFTTIDNLFHIYAQSPDGAGLFPLYGQHSGDHSASSFGEDHLAAHFLTQASDGRVWFADYYRKNNKGLGIVAGFMPEPEGQEGIGPKEATKTADIYVPRDVINFAPWAINGDSASEPMPPPQVKHPNYSDPLPFAAKLGHPAALPNNGLMLAVGNGACSTVASDKIFKHLGFMQIPAFVNGSGSGAAMNMMTSLNMDTPGCDVGIYKATVIPSAHPNDLELIVDNKEWHEFMAKALVPYAAIHEIEAPKVIPRVDIGVSHEKLALGTPFGLLGAASITDRETHPQGGISFDDLHQFHLQGTDTINYSDEDLCGIRMLSVRPNRSRNVSYDIANLAGERVAILGEVPVLHYDTNGKRLVDTTGNPDTSFLLRMPANMPYMMQGIDCEGRTLNTDQSWQHLRPGEMKTCGGCHVHSKPAREQFVNTHAATSNYTIPQLGEGVIPLLDGLDGNTVRTRAVLGNELQIEFTRDIKPILDAHCIACHGGAIPAAGLALDKHGSKNNEDGTTWWRLVADYKQKYIPDNLKIATKTPGGFERPQVSKYIRAFNSLGSLLYWKATNERTDRNLDTSFPNDIDFGPDHPTGITKQQLGILSRWIDIGAPGGTKELDDTQKPTLHLAALVVDNKITELRVGTVDSGSRINPASLSVCVKDTQGNCKNIAGRTEINGITRIILTSPITDANTGIEARVRDMSGNETFVTRTAKWFLVN